MSHRLVRVPLRNHIHRRSYLRTTGSNVTTKSSGALLLHRGVAGGRASANPRKYRPSTVRRCRFELCPTLFSLSLPTSDRYPRRDATVPSSDGDATRPPCDAGTEPCRPMFRRSQPSANAFLRLVCGSNSPPPDSPFLSAPPSVPPKCARRTNMHRPDNSSDSTPFLDRRTTRRDYYSHRKLC